MTSGTRWILQGSLVLPLTLVACGDGATDPEPVLDRVEVVQGADQAGSVGLPLDSLIVLQTVADDGSPMPDITLALAVTGDGGLDRNSATTGSDGTVSIEWTLATVPGLDTLTVTPTGEDAALAVVTATGLADRPDTMALMDGDGQSELGGVALPAPIRVRLSDAFGNPVAGVPVEFAVTGGGGAVEPAEVETGLDGVAAAGWTLGPTVGEQTAEALVRDSVVYDLVDLPGSPVPFSATAVSFALDSIHPDPTAVGDTIILTGTGFGPDPGEHEVRIDGRAATIVAVSQTSVEVAVPSFGCTAVQPRDLTLVRGADTATTEIAVEPTNLLALGRGERVTITDPGEFCVQLPGSATDSARYVVGLTSTREWSAAAAFTVTARDSAVAEIAAAPSATVTLASTEDATEETPPSPEERLRAWERSFLTSSALAGTATASETEVSADVSSGATVGDDISFRVPYVHTDPCNDYSTRASTIVYAGPQVVVAIPEVPDLALSTLLGSSTFQAARDQLVAILEGPVWNDVAAYVGDLGNVATDLDTDGRATVVFTSALYGQDVPRAFSTAVDLLDRSTCPSSDEGMFVYVTIPPLDYGALSTAIATLNEAMQTSPPGITHQLAHVAQNVRRIAAGIATPLPTWLGEGQAELMVEVVGHARTGRGPGMDYGASVVTASEVATRWYRPLFEHLSYFFGWDGASGRVEGAPEECSLYGFGGGGVPCEPLAGPGAAWSFVRYISDRVGPELSGGEAELSRAIALLADSDELGTLLATHSGSDLAEVFADWAMTLYTDGRLSATEAPELQLASWDLADVFASMAVEQRLTPIEQGFQSFTLDGSVAGGGTAYLAIGAPGGHGPVALRFADPLARPLSEEIEPQLWVVRVR